MYSKKTLLAVLVLLCVMNTLALTKFDFLNITGQQCGIVSCSTYYTATNPTGITLTITNNTMLKVSSNIDMIGTSKGYWIEVYNASNQWQNIQSIASISVGAGQKISFRINGNFTPSYPTVESVKYAIDHVPSFNNFTFPEYDAWNQTWGKCINLNYTYNLNNYSRINETFPQRILLNNSIINLSALRSDWGDLRFAKGSCQNVSTDYTHNLVYKNSSAAEAVFFFGAGDIVNNTPAQVAIYYNNSGVTHLEGARTGVSFGYNGVGSGVRIFTNDVVGDTGALSSSSFNDTSPFPLTTIGIANIIAGGKWGREKQTTSGNQTFFTSFGFDNSDAINTIRGVSTSFNFLLYPEPVNRTIRLYGIGNISDTAKTNIVDVEIVVT